MLVPAQPALAGMDAYVVFTQALEPGAQQGRGLHVGGKHPARTADKGVDAQPVNPFAQRIRGEGIEQRAQVAGALGVAADERGVILGMGDVHAADAGQQELAPHRGHGVIQVDIHACLPEHLGGHQAGRTTTDDGDAKRRGLGHGGNRAGERGGHCSC